MTQAAAAPAIKTSVYFRLSPGANTIIAELSRRMGISRASVVEVALRRMVMAEEAAKAASGKLPQER